MKKEKKIRTYGEINEKILAKSVSVMTAEEFKAKVETDGLEKAAEEVDVVTTGTFGAMCSSGLLLNFGHSDPPIKMQKILLDEIPAFGGLAAVDTYLGATEMDESLNFFRGGAHVIEDIVRGKPVRLKAHSYGTDCYPRKDIDTWISLKTVNQAVLLNPRNCYQNYAAATNSSDKIIYTYMGKLLPEFGNVTYSSAGELSPLLNDPFYRTIGIGTRIFLGGGDGYVFWEGTQFNAKTPRAPNGTPTRPAGAIAVVGDLKKMSADYLRGLTMHRYGTTLAVGIGIPIPILDLEMAKFCSVRDADISTAVFDYSEEKRSRGVVREANYEELKSGELEIKGTKVPTSSLSSMYKARQITVELKNRIVNGNFLLQEPIERFDLEHTMKPLEIRTREEVLK
ncbi:MAG TPA: hypothetical protein ENN25_03720 [Euryarchaeota archaeon]|nr:hypothetical protein [Euryarchaeota archaeon]